MDRADQLYAGFCNNYKIKFDIKRNAIVPQHRCLLPLNEDDHKAFLQNERDFTMSMFGAFDWIQKNDDACSESEYCNYICIFQLYGKVSFYAAIKVILSLGRFETTFVIYNDYDKIIRCIIFPNGEVSLFDIKWNKKILDKIQKTFIEYINIHKYIRENLTYDKYENNCYYHESSIMTVTTNNYKNFISIDGEQKTFAEIFQESSC